MPHVIVVFETCVVCGEECLTIQGSDIIPMCAGQGSDIIPMCAGHSEHDKMIALAKLERKIARTRELIYAENS